MTNKRRPSAVLFTLCDAVFAWHYLTWLIILKIYNLRISGAWNSFLNQIINCPSFCSWLLNGRPGLEIDLSWKKKKHYNRFFFYAYVQLPLPSQNCRADLWVQMRCVSVLSPSPYSPNHVRFNNTEEQSLVLEDLFMTGPLSILFIIGQSIL